MDPDASKGKQLMKSRLELVEGAHAQEGPFTLGVQTAFSEKGEEKKATIIRECGSYEELSREIEEYKNALDHLLVDAKAVFEERSSSETGEVGETWEALQNAPDEDTFISRFNALSEDTRIELAEYVLTTQNIFKGFASVFSKRYVEESHTMS